MPAADAADLFIVGKTMRRKINENESMDDANHDPTHHSKRKCSSGECTIN